MSNNEESLDENTVFLPVDESSPEFIYSERERKAVEKLLSAGPEAFYSSVVKELPNCFLSSEEVSQLKSWVQSYSFNEPRLQHENGAENIAEMDDFCSSYFPCHSDVPVPGLDLGWPDKIPWSVTASVTVHTSPPAEGGPSVREVIRRHLQRARQVIAIVVDRLTDSAIIGDLHRAASRGVPVYIILNQRSIQEKFSSNRLCHPNIRVRALGGRSFGLRDGRKLVGEMNEKFLLVDLDTVIHGSYSFTWTDTHLHRQLITVLRGPAVDAFDREFRILYASSLPVLSTATHVNQNHQLKDISDVRLLKRISVDPDITDPPSPRAVSPLDWDKMGVFSEESSLPTSPLYLHGEVVKLEMPLQNSMQLDKNTPLMDGFTNNQNYIVDKRRNREPLTAEPATSERTKRITDSLSPVATDMEKSTFKSRESLSTQPDTSDRTKRNREPVSTQPATSDRVKKLSGSMSPLATDIEKSTVFKESLSTQPDTSDRTKRAKDKISPVATDVVEKSTFKNREPVSTQPATSDRIKKLSGSMSPVATDIEKSTVFKSRESLSTQPDTSDRTKRVKDNLPPESTNVIENLLFKSRESLSTQPAPLERTKSMERDTSRHHPTERSTTLYTRNTSRYDDKANEATHRRYSFQARRYSIAEEESKTDDIATKMVNNPSSRKPLILSVHGNENFSALSDIMRKIPQTSSGLLKRESKSIHTQSMWDLSKEDAATSHEKKGVSVPRYTRPTYEPSYITPGLALMEKRNDKVRSTLMPTERPRSYTFLGVDSGRKKGENHE
ncbi:protein FAM83D isoform X3 [Oreochromis niloticus]|uniref:protein FAM83D isoform X3 n=1 Tax=Oreochromis niloticus TaxID=8128 RepID=UPI0009056725|nr:protein FAM83D-like isoform X3 [Oreochromis niloticus]